MTQRLNKDYLTQYYYHNKTLLFYLNLIKVSLSQCFGKRDHMSQNKNRKQENLILNY